MNIETSDATLRITGSFGVAFSSSSVEALAAILARADAALYEAKTLGRNQVRLLESTGDVDATTSQARRSAAGHQKS